MTMRERPEAQKRLASLPNGGDISWSICTCNFIPFEQLPIRTVMIEGTLAHECSHKELQTRS
jgi:hypothetical protein